MTDYRALAQSVANNGHYRLPPPDTLRLGQVIGYDPSHENGVHGSPTLTVSIASDASIVHGVHFHNSYSPIMGDTVWISWSGDDVWVNGSMAHAKNDFPPGVVGFRRSVQTVIGHGDFTSKYTTPFASPFWWKQYQPVQTTDSYAFTVNTNILPNRLYKAELLVSFKVTGTASVVSIGIITPDGISATSSTTQAPHQVWQSNTLTNTTYTVSASTTWWDNNPAHYTQPNAWGNRHPANKASWGLAVLVANAATTVTLVETAPQRLIVSDLGVYS